MEKMPKMERSDDLQLLLAPVYSSPPRLIILLPDEAENYAEHGSDQCCLTALAGI